MQTLPCGHRVVCRKCFIKTIQSAIADHSLPLKCIVCRASVLKLGSCKVEKSSSTHQPPTSSSSSSVTPSRSTRRPVSSLATRAPQSKATTACVAAASRGPTAGAVNTNSEQLLSRSGDLGRPSDLSSTAARLRESSSHRGNHRGCCHHHHIPLRQLSSHQDAGPSVVGATGTKITKLQPLPIYPARGSAPTQRRAFSSTAAPSAKASSSVSDAKECASSSAVRTAVTGHRVS